MVDLHLVLDNSAAVDDVICEASIAVLFTNAAHGDRTIAQSS